MNIFTTVLTQPLTNGLILFYRILGGNMGLAIIGFSLFLRFILSPLQKPYMDSMKKIKDAAPQIEKLKAKYKDDKLKFAKAQADFYKEKGINPGAGCLPYILQIVILIAFFNVFAKTLYPGVDSVASFNKLLYEPLKFGSGEALNTNFLYLDIKKPDIFNLAFLPFPLPGPFLILSALAQFLSAKMMQPIAAIEGAVAKKTKGTEDDMQVAMQKSMIYTFPLMTIIIGLRFPSGLALYWLIFSASQLYSQYRSQGWGGLTPWINRLNLLKSPKLNS